VPRSFTSVLRGAGYWTGYSTDNPFLGFAPPTRAFARASTPSLGAAGSWAGAAAACPSASCATWLHPATADARSRQRMRRYLANGRYSRDETRSFAARVFKDGIRLLEPGARRRPFALVLDTFECHEPWTPRSRASYIPTYVRR